MTYPVINSSYDFGPSKYILGNNVGYTNFLTAFNAVVSAGGGTIYIQSPLTLSFTGTLNPNGTIVNIVAANSTTYPFYSVGLGSDVIFNGNITITSSSAGQLRFENILFKSTTGDTFTISGTPSTGFVISFEGCGISATAGNGFVVNNTTSKVDLSMNNIFSSTSGLFVSSTATSGVLLDVSSSSVGNISVSNGSTLLLESCSLTQISLAASTLQSQYNYYISSNPTIDLTANGSTVNSFGDTFQSTASSGYFIDTSTSSTGTVNVADAAILGSAQSINPLLTTTLYPNLINPSWISISASRTAGIGQGYIATAALTITLPSSPAVGSIVRFIADTASAVVIQAAAGQTIRLGNAASSTAGTMTSSARGDSATLIYSSSSTSWIATQAIGNLLLA